MVEFSYNKGSYMHSAHETDNVAVSGASLADVTPSSGKNNPIDVRSFRDFSIVFRNDGNTNSLSYAVLGSCDEAADASTVDANSWSTLVSTTALATETTGSVHYIPQGVRWIKIQALSASGSTLEWWWNARS